MITSQSFPSRRSSLNTSQAIALIFLSISEAEQPLCAALPFMSEPGPAGGVRGGRFRLVLLHLLRNSPEGVWNRPPSEVTLVALGVLPALHGCPAISTLRAPALQETTASFSRTVLWFGELSVMLGATAAARPGPRARPAGGCRSWLPFNAGTALARLPRERDVGRTNTGTQRGERAARVQSLSAPFGGFRNLSAPFGGFRSISAPFGALRSLSEPSGCSRLHAAVPVSAARCRVGAAPLPVVALFRSAAPWRCWVGAVAAIGSRHVVLLFFFVF